MAETDGQENEVVIEEKSNVVNHYNSDLDPQHAEYAAKTPSEASSNYLSGWRLHTTTFALCLSIWLATLEISIVSTSLISITDDLLGFSKSSWIIIAYLLTYTCFFIIWAKISDLFGRKLCIIVAVFLFTVFSGGSGAAQTITQLIICRAFQGIGGSGAYSLTVVIFFEMVPETKYALYTSMVSIVFALAMLLGPVIGGAISSNTTWRWVFLLNVPAGVVAIILLLFTIPSHFPHQDQRSDKARYSLGFPPASSLRRLDGLGFLLFLAACLLLLTSLQLAGLDFSWSSAAVLSLLIISIVLWPIFILWEWHVTRKAGVVEPIFPWRLMTNRVWMAMALTNFLCGISYTVPVVEIPLRFQSVYGTSPLRAGTSLLAFAIMTAVGSFWAAMVASKFKVPPVFILIIGAGLQVVGAALLSTIPIEENIWPGQYGYQVLLGLGMGANGALLAVMTPFAIYKRDQSVAMGAITQFRMMGGAVGLAIATCVFNGYVKSRLSDVLSAAQLGAVLQTAEAIGKLPPALQDMVKEVFARAFAVQFRIIIGTSAAQFLGIGLMWQKKLLRVA
ncbi:MAG: hypothetical protein M1820_002957 [Bogoriella megaspora]|nr:MAG: hypothetical protein M1820_002957 [Bogoriella megaspora]